MPSHNLSWYSRNSIRARGNMQLRLASLMRKLGRDGFKRGDFRIDQITIGIPGLDPAFENYRIVQIADIHIGHWISPERMEGVVDLVNEQSPDLVVITGDFVSYILEPLTDSLSASLTKLRSRDGCLGVLGNHDHWMDAQKVNEVLELSGMTILNNDVFAIHRGRAVLYIAGVDDITVKKDRLDVVLEKLPSDGPAILLAHEPDFADKSARTGRFALQLSGHSHGGQIVWPRIGPLIRGPGFFKYPNGLYQVGRMVQYTNRGVGTHVFRLRINCPPEITVISLTPKP